MGLLKIFSKSSPGVRRLPSGSMTVDGNGKILASTFSSSCSPELLKQVAVQVLRLLRESRSGQLPLAEISLQFASLRIVARELRGGAMIFITPKS